MEKMMFQNMGESVNASQERKELSPEQQIELIESASLEELFFYVMTNKPPKARLHEEVERIKSVSSEEIVAYFGAK